MATTKEGIVVADADARYTFDETKLAELRKSSPWKDDPRYFQSVAIGPSAVMKMVSCGVISVLFIFTNDDQFVIVSHIPPSPYYMQMTHCHSGVEKGIKKGGNPIEVMGLLLGRPDPTTPRTLIVTDVFPLPIEGFETRVVADDGDVINHMIELGESLENTRKEKFMGWYHSHPFDLGPTSHCYMSQTDISTQLQWQRAEDPHGNPFLAIVVDPLRSLARGNPELKAFRAYPPEYTHPTLNQCPNGSVIHDEQSRLEQWGSCWASYYELSVEYYMSGGARIVLSTLTRNFLWMRTLGSTPTCELEVRNRHVAGVCGCAELLSKFLPTSSGAGDAPSSLVGSRGVGGSSTSSSGRTGMASTSAASPKVAGSGERSGGGKPSSSSSSSSTPAVTVPSSGKEDEDVLAKSCQTVIDIATEKLIGSITQTVKKELFTQSMLLH